MEAAEVGFNRLSLEERSKFTHETLSNYNSAQNERSLSSSALGAGTEDGTVDGMLTTDADEGYIVVTLLAAAERRLNFPDTIAGEAELRQALSSLGAIAADELVAVEILWSPQADGDVLSKDDILTHYPDLRLV